ncbi:MAG: TRAP transporter large permease subunit [Rhodospirillaceae bacterium]|nr:TRAP transporter large permease subunit [Rhodospirillaceae bacterium]MBT4115434.1 TRAP transporter large permease subunit [Rhodospirillaceae bacterium]MBT4674947.1 TRAP transporter large permease subunit [Rhodospirillaceae bacterium]MBT4719008.1 TRAP transporter large permease subunit [Rhodospirillaceae bacterium]MBT4748592.1 TRAP transporter large permease subunit [Rhodospirillaceae bacterium]
MQTSTSTAAEAPILRRLGGGLSTIPLWMNSLGAIWVCFVMVLVCADIFGRNVLNAPVRGVPEILSYSVVSIVFLQLAHTLLMGRFTKADLITGWLDNNRPVAGALMAAVFNLIGGVVFILLSYVTYPHLLKSFAEREVDGMPTGVVFLVWPFRLIMFLGAAVTAVVFLSICFNALVKLRRHITELRADKDARSGWPAALAFAAVVAAAWLFAQTEPSNVLIGLVSVLFMLILIAFGMHIGVALIVIGFFGIWMVRDNPIIAERTLWQTGSEFLRNHILAVIPLFVMMGLLVGASDIGRETFDVARWSLRRVKGGLGVATVAANAIFAAITGSSIASAAVFTKIATPEMQRYGYTNKFSVGVVAGTSVLGMLIPPSLLLIVYGFLAETSVGILFLAAVIPGIILAGSMGLGIIFMAYKMPGFVGGTEIDENEPGETIRSSAIKLFPIALLIFVVLGGIYGGILTPAEAGAAGAAGALIIAIARRKLTVMRFWNVVVETGHITVSILFLILAANMYSRMLAMSGLPQFTSELIAAAGLSFLGFMFAYILLVILLGMVLDSISIMLIILPLALPVVVGMGGDLVWFGIVSVVAVEIGLLTPPVGLTCYVVKSVLDDDSITLGDIFKGAFPFVLIMLVVVILLVLVPEISLIFV